MRVCDALLELMVARCTVVHRVESSCHVVGALKDVDLTTLRHRACACIGITHLKKRMQHTVFTPYLRPVSIYRSDVIEIGQHPNCGPQALSCIPLGACFDTAEFLRKACTYVHTASTED